jgi:hypothetical protein
MRKTLLLISVVLLSSLWTSKANAQDVINLTTTDNIATVLSSYTGTNVVLVVPTGYTNPQAITAIALPALTAGVKVTLRGDGSMPLLSVVGFSVPATTGINYSAVKFEKLTLTGAKADPTTDYVFNIATGTAFNVDTLVFSGCNISTFRSLARFQSTNTTIDQKIGYVLIDNCKVSNCADYGIIYNNKVGASFGPIVARKSTFFGFGQNVFMCQTNTASVSISDCTFDNVITATTAKYIVDLNAQVSPVTLTNCIFGSSLAGSKCVRTGGTATITNCYKNASCTMGDSIKATAGITGSVTAYAGTSATLFAAPNTSTAGASFVGTGADYTIIDATFPGKNNAGDPRWYSATGVISPKASSTVVSYNGTEISVSEPQDIAIYNVSGQLLKSAKQVKVMGTANLAKGVYIVKAGSSIQKFIAQ